MGDKEHLQINLALMNGVSTTIIPHAQPCGQAGPGACCNALERLADAAFLCSPSGFYKGLLEKGKTG